MNHFRGFNIWVPQTSSARISGTIWWFLKLFAPDDDLLSPEQDDVLYPFTTERHSPQPSGADLLGRCFEDPTVGVCCITHLGPIVDPDDKYRGEYTLHYRCLHTQAEYMSTVDQIVQWIKDAPPLPRPAREVRLQPAAPVTYPVYSRWDPCDSHTTNAQDQAAIHHETTPALAPPTIASVREKPIDVTNAPLAELRRSQRKRKAPEFLQPKFKGKAYAIIPPPRLPRKQRVPIEWAYVEKQRVSLQNMKSQRRLRLRDPSLDARPCQNMFWKYREQQRARINKRAGWWSVLYSNKPKKGHALTSDSIDDVYSRGMPSSKLPPI